MCISGRYNTEAHLGESFRIAKREGGEGDAYGQREPWVAPPSVGAGIAAGPGGERQAGTSAGSSDGAVLPKRHARFMERFRAAKESKGASAGGVTSFGAVLPDTVGRAD